MGSECWRGTSYDMKKVEAFHIGRLGKLCRLFWPEKISNAHLHKKIKCNSVVREIKGRRFKWLGHVLRMDQDRIPKIARRWTPPGKRKQGRPKNTWRRTVMNRTWGEAQHAAQDGSRWRQIGEAVCPIRDEEDYDKIVMGSY